MRFEIFHFLILALLVGAEPSYEDKIEKLEYYGLDPEVHQKDTEYVLVLGSGGLIGSQLVKELKEQGYPVLEVRSRTHLDLRVRGNLDIFDPVRLRMVFFLACEVGGSKFLDESEQIIEKHNGLIYKEVFPFLESKSKDTKFIFASSSLAGDDSAYGRIKLEGEEKTASMESGKSVRFWNVYGTETVGLKSHVLTDWVYSCLHQEPQKGVTRVQSLSNGLEKRQFMHVSDAAKGLVMMMEEWDSALDGIKVVDFASGLWVTLRDVAESIQRVSKSRCEIVFNESRTPRERKIMEPNLSKEFHKMVFPPEDIKEMDKGIAQMYKELAEVIENKTFHYGRLVALILAVLATFVARFFV